MKEQYITLPMRGIRILAPEETGRNMLLSNNSQVTPTEIRGEIIWTENEKTRLIAIQQNPFFKKRFPTSKDGKEYMADVNPERNRELEHLAAILSSQIINTVKIIAPYMPYAIILYGSVAQGLARSKNHPDPTDIDISIIGDFYEDQKNDLFNNIQDARDEISMTITRNNPNIMDGYMNRRLCGVKIQNPRSLVNNNYSGAINYIQSCARPLIDESGIWSSLENEALIIYKRQKIDGERPNLSRPTSESIVKYETEHKRNRNQSNF